MSKKSGSIVKIVAFVAGVAAVGTACYVYKDKIKEFFEKNDVKGKINNAKDFVSEKVLKNKNDDYFDDAEFFDDDDTVEEDTSNRGYTSITITSDEDSEATTDKEEVSNTEETAAKAAAEENIPVTDEIKEITSADNTKVIEEDTPKEYEYEGLSDVSEDEDVLADEAALDGADF